jgi:hypothetical protein
MSVVMVAVAAGVAMFVALLIYAKEPSELDGK